MQLPDGTARLLYLPAVRGQTCAGQPPEIWLGTPETRQAEHLWTIDQGMPGVMGTTYTLPRAFLWSPQSNHVFLYEGDACGLGGNWRVDLDASQAQQLPITGRLLTWAPQGIVTQNRDSFALALWNESGEKIGEILFTTPNPA